MKPTKWSLADLPWDRVDASKVSVDTLRVVKAASLVERNAGDYVAYLSNVFVDDPEFRQRIRQWGAEEIQHGEALGHWVQQVDPSFSFHREYRQFSEAYRIPLDAQESVRGSPAGELVARCVVEIGTSSLYSALRDATDEPVLKRLCDNIAKDEIRHYKMFHDYLQKYNQEDRLNLLRRALVAYQRFREIDDDELSLAYHCGNTPHRAYDQQLAARTYARLAFRHYRRDHVDRAVTLTLKAIGLSPHRRLSALISALAWRQFRHQRAMLEAA